MQIVNLDVMMARRKMSLNELFEKSKPDGVQPFNTEERERVLRLCKPSVKLDCQPGDILEFVADQKK
jgi:putative transcriptional regulator